MSASLKKTSVIQKSSPTVSVIITAHREGVIVGATLRSAFEAISYLSDVYGRAAEIVVMLDNADQVTRSIVEGGLGSAGRVVETKLGDPGQVRNAGVDYATGEFVAFLDGDDLWSYNWLAEAYALASTRPDVVVHSNCNVVFGQEKNIWWHIDSEGPLFDPAYLEWGNYWDAMAFARTEIYRRFRFRPNDLSLGFGHEDWHWNVMTVRAGVPHKPAPQTVHFKRRRHGSVSAKVNERNGTVWPQEIHKTT